MQRALHRIATLPWTEPAVFQDNVQERTDVDQFQRFVAKSEKISIGFHTIFAHTEKLHVFSLELCESLSIFYILNMLKISLGMGLDYKNRL